MASVIALVLAVVVIWSWASSRSDVSQAPPDALGFSEVGTWQGVSFWFKSGPHNTVSVRTTGRLGDMCDTTGPGGYTRILLCADSAPQGGISAALVPDGLTTPKVGGQALHVIDMAGPLNLAVVIVGAGDVPPQGAVG